MLKIRQNLKNLSLKKLYFERSLKFEFGKTVKNLNIKSPLKIEFSKAVNFSYFLGKLKLESILINN